MASGADLTRMEPQTIRGNTMNTATKKDLELIYRHAHKNFKGIAAGKKFILVLRYGTERVQLEDLTDEEVAARLPRAKAAEAARLASRSVAA